MTKEKVETTFSKSELLKAKKFLKYQDILNALLKDDKKYSVKETETIINKFLTNKVR